MQYKVTKADLEKSFKFSVDYHLYPSHPASNRTTGQSRGLGGVLDSFLVGKVVELAISNILKSFISSKEFNLDFEMHSTKEHDGDPDIYEIVENGVKRDPKIYVEIKNIGATDRWVGLTAEQFKTIKSNKIVDKNLEKFILICATIKNTEKTNKKKDDLLGVFLKDELNSTLPHDFSNLKDFIVEVKAVVTGEELDEKGIKFNKGRYMLETEVFEEYDCKKLKKELEKEHTKLKKVVISNNKLPKYNFNKNYEYSSEYGDFNIIGNANVFIKDNEKSARVYLICDSDCVIENLSLGKFNLKKDKAYIFKPMTIGRNPVLNRNNILIARRNIENIASESVEVRLSKLAREI